MPFNQLIYYRDFLFTLTQKELKARYKRTYFGFLWLILNPLLQMLIIGTVFARFINIPHYYLYLFTGLLPWQFFSQSLTKVVSCFVFERSLLKKAYFPHTLIPLSLILSHLINFVLSLILLLLLLFLIKPPIYIHLLVLIPTLIWLFLCTFGLSLLLASLNVKYRDVSFFTQTLITLWFYATPILYQLHQIPSNLSFAYYLNPLTAIFGLLQFSLLQLSPPSPTLILTNLSLSLVILVFGLLIYHRLHRSFVDWL